MDISLHLARNFVIGEMLAKTARKFPDRPAPGQTLTEEEVISFCALNLAGYKKPRSVEFAGALPRNAAGKVLKTRLREKSGPAVKY